MHEMILCKLGEVVLKGLNRRSFEMKLMSNLRRRTCLLYTSSCRKPRQEPPGRAAPAGSMT